MIISWLFQKTSESGFRPQLGWADGDKRALVWLPGKKLVSGTWLKMCMDRSVYQGCTQLAYEHYNEPMMGQRCKVVWIGVDIDDEPIRDDKLIEAIRPFHGSLRSSCGGAGRHALIRLMNPLPAFHETANATVKKLLEPVVLGIESSGHRICQANKRMFWLQGGMNTWIHRDDEFWTPQAVHPSVPYVPAVTTFEPTAGLSPEIGHWVSLFQRHGLVGEIKERNTVYIGGFVKVLREAGQTVETRSPMTGNGQVNGYLDVQPGYISLWSYIDGHSIWCRQDLSVFGM